MILNPKWLNWLKEDEDGNLTILKENTPEDIKQEYEKLLQEEQQSIQKGKLKKTIF